MAEPIEKKLVLPVEDMSAPSSQDMPDLSPETLSTVRFGSTLFGLPGQTTPELHIYRQDFLDQEGFSSPETLDELMEIARRMHDPQHGINGIRWNGARGGPVGTNFLMLLADFDQSVLNLPRPGRRLGDSNLAPKTTGHDCLRRRH